MHYAGTACDMDEIIELAKENRLYIIEDAAQGVNARYNDKYLGGLGDLACYSFHSSKNYISGEGGALVINNKSEKLQERAEILRENGTNRLSFLRGEVDKYTWVDKGPSYLPSDLLMAVLFAQLEEMDHIKEMRQKVFLQYYNGLKEFLETPFVDSISSVLEKRDLNYHMFYLKLQNNKLRDYFLRNLCKKGIYAHFHYLPLHSSPMGEELGYKPEELPITQEVASSILRLPLYPELTTEEIDYIIENIRILFKGLQ